MRRFQLLYLPISFLLLLSCKTNFVPENVERTVIQKKIISNEYFSSLKTDYIYKAQIEIYGNTLSGLLIIKKINEKTHRLLMTTDFGNKLLDVEIADNIFKINYITDNLNRKIVLKVLEQDFKILLRKDYEIKQSWANTNELVLESQEGKNGYFLYLNPKTELLEKIVVIKSDKEQINFTFGAKTPILADKISIVHQDIKLKINLNQIADNQEISLEK